MEDATTVECRLALDRNSPIPLWAQVESFLATAILQNRLTVGNRLESETHLASRFLVSRGTIRHAMARLEDRGLLDQVRGGSTAAGCRVITAPVAATRT